MLLPKSNVLVSISGKSGKDTKPATVKPIKPASPFNQLGQYANSPGNRVYWICSFFPVTIASTHFAFPQRNDQAVLALVAWLNTKTVYPQMVTHLSSTNLVHCRVTSLLCPTTLPQSQTVHHSSYN